MLQPIAMQANTATWTRLSPQKSSRAPPGDSRNFEPGQLAVAAVEDRVGQEQQTARHLQQRIPRQEEGRPEQADRQAHQGHRVRGDRGPHQATGDREREPALDVAGHEPLGVLDQALQEPGLRGLGPVTANQRKPAGRIARGGDVRAATGQLRDRVRRARRAEQGVSVHLVHRGGSRRIDGRRAGVERHLAGGGAASAAWGSTLAGSRTSRPGAPAIESAPNIPAPVPSSSRGSGHARGPPARAGSRRGRGQDNAAQQREPGDHGLGRRRSRPRRAGRTTSRLGVSSAGAARTVIPRPRRGPGSTGARGAPGARRRAGSTRARGTRSPRRPRPRRGWGSARRDEPRGARGTRRRPR